MSVFLLTHFPPADFTYLFAEAFQSNMFSRNIPVNTATRNSIIAQDGMVVFNSDTDEFEAWYNSQWNPFGIINPVKQIVGTITSAQLNNLASSPVVIVPGQGTGTVVMATNAFLEYVPGTIGFTGSGQTQLNIGPVVDLLIGPATGQMGTTTGISVFGSIASQNVPTVDMNNQNLQIITTGTISSGNGSLKYNIMYLDYI